MYIHMCMCVCTHTYIYMFCFPLNISLCGCCLMFWGLSGWEKWVVGWEIVVMMYHWMAELTAPLGDGRSVPRWVEEFTRANELVGPLTDGRQQLRPGPTGGHQVWQCVDRKLCLLQRLKKCKRCRYTMQRPPAPARTPLSPYFTLVSLHVFRLSTVDLSLFSFFLCATFVIWPHWMKQR